MPTKNSQLVAEVEELTQMFREDEDFAPHRKLASQHDIAPERAFLAGFIEAEEPWETGAIVAADGRILHYDRKTGAGGKFEQVQWVNDPTTLLDSFAAICVAADMAQGKN